MSQNNLGELITGKLTTSDLYQDVETVACTCGTKSVCHIDGTDDGDEAMLL